MFFSFLNARLHEFSTSLKARKRHGFTLTEMAIVCAVIGMALGGTWVGLGRVSNNNKARIFNGEVQKFVENYHKLFAGHGIDMAYGTDITCMGILAGVFPSEMIPVGLTCTQSVSGNNGYIGTKNITTPWGGSTYITVNVDTDSIQATSFKPPDVIKVYFWNLTAQQCTTMAQTILANPNVVLTTFSNGWASFLNGYNTNYMPTPTPELVATNCAGAGATSWFSAGYLIK